MYAHIYEYHIFDGRTFEHSRLKSMPTPRFSPNPLRPTSQKLGALKPPLVEFKRAVSPVRRVLMALARRLFQICTTAIAEALAREDLTPLQYAVMAYVEGEPDIDQNGLAARLGVDRNNASLLVEQLEAKQLIERRVNGADRRARLLRVTSRGQKLYDRLRPVVFAAQERLLSLLTPVEREQLLNLLVRVIEGNRSLARPGTGRRKRGSSQSLSTNT
jgi:MarR family transcriptional regulator, lower aerobic nicotinate degradation pathway regulator